MWPSDCRGQSLRRALQVNGGVLRIDAVASLFNHESSGPKRLTVERRRAASSRVGWFGPSASASSSALACGARGQGHRSHALGVRGSAWVVRPSPPWSPGGGAQDLNQVRAVGGRRASAKAYRVVVSPVARMSSAQNNGLHLTRARGVALASRRGPVVEGALAGEAGCSTDVQSVRRK